jgi:hypothetical protein
MLTTWTAKGWKPEHIKEGLPPTPYPLKTVVLPTDD